MILYFEELHLLLRQGWFLKMYDLWSCKSRWL